MRPLQCRFYSLAPYLDANGELKLILSPVNLPYQCPLITEKIPLQPQFIRATRTVRKRLIKDPLIRDLVEMDSREQREKGIKIEEPM